DQYIGTPFVHADVDFKVPMTPRDTLIIEVTVGRLGEKSLGFKLYGYSEVSKTVTFSGNFVCCFTDTKSFQPISIPPQMRIRIEEYKNNQHLIMEGAID
ncbi:acyl-CoA thioesterase, partial [Saccharospirillum sp.]